MYRSTILEIIVATVCLMIGTLCLSATDQEKADSPPPTLTETSTEVLGGSKHIANYSGALLSVDKPEESARLILSQQMAGRAILHAQLDVALARIALNETDSEHVKELAQGIILDQTKILNRLAGIGPKRQAANSIATEKSSDTTATEKTLELADPVRAFADQCLDHEQAATREQLRLLKREFTNCNRMAFDRLYMHQVVLHSLQSLAALNACHHDAEPEFEKVVADQIRLTDEHLQKAKALLKSESSLSQDSATSEQ